MDARVASVQRSAETAKQMVPERSFRDTFSLVGPEWTSKMNTAVTQMEQRLESDRMLADRDAATETLLRR